LVRLLHYSRQAARHREKAAAGRAKEFEHFAQSLRLHAILEVADTVMGEAGLLPELIMQTLARLGSSELTDSRKKLKFSYYVEFRKWN
jgi:hypothetical protein